MPSDSLAGEFVLKKNSDKSLKVLNSQKTHKATLFTNFCEYPVNITFENQDEDEIIILLVKRDLITNLPWILAALFLLLTPPLASANSGLFTPFFNVKFQTLLLLIPFYYLIVVGFVITQFIIWFFNVGLVTNKRIIDLDVHGILTKHFSETKLTLIEDVSYSQVGSIRSLFNYGDVTMQTAGTNVNFEFDRAPNPAKITKIVAGMIGGKSLK